MEVWQVIQGPALIPAGTVLQLSDSQMSSRRQQLKRLASGWWMAVSDLSFKTGEVVAFYDPLDQPFLEPFIPPEMKKPILCHPNHRPKAQKAL